MRDRLCMGGLMSASHSDAMNEIYNEIPIADAKIRKIFEICKFLKRKLLGRRELYAKCEPLLWLQGFAFSGEKGNSLGSGTKTYGSISAGEYTIPVYWLMIESWRIKNTAGSVLLI